jgi:hypothetical protein
MEQEVLDQLSRPAAVRERSGARAGLAGPGAGGRLYLGTVVLETGGCALRASA